MKITGLENHWFYKALSWLPKVSQHIKIINSQLKYILEKSKTKKYVVKRVRPEPKFEVSF